MVAWYRDRLGLRSLVRVVDDRYALLQAGTAHLAILGRDAAGEPSPRWSLALEVDDLAAVLTRFEQVEPRPVIRQHPEGYCETTLLDPDGNRVKLFSWNPTSRASLS